MAKPSAVDSNGTMGQLETDVTNAIWHAFDTLGDGNSGKVAKSRLKVFTSSLGTVLGYTRAEAALEEYCSTQELQFEQYMVYLLKELFQGLPSTLDLKTIKKYRDHIEEVCWLVCKKKYLDREFVAFPEKCVAQLFRVFCFLGELRTSQKDMTEVIMVAEEVEEVTSTFVKALGKEWDSQDFRQLATLLPVFHFQSFLAFLETRYTAASEPCGLVEACAEVCDIYVGDVIKKGLLKKKMSTLGLWWEMYFVLRPHSFTYFGTKEGSRKSGEICITSRTRAEPVGDSSTRKGHRFLVTTDDKVVELSASDYKSKLQWMSAIQTAAQNSYTYRSYQRHLAIKRRNERQACHTRKQEEERQRLQHLAQLEKEKEARRQAEEQLKSEHQKRQELEAAQQELERKLEEERQAKRDEEIVRTLQSRILAEEWEKREQLEQERAEQQKQLEEESRRREHLEQLRRQKDREINSIAQKLSSLKTEKVLLNSQLEVMDTLEGQLRQERSRAEELKQRLDAEQAKTLDLLTQLNGQRSSCLELEMALANCRSDLADANRQILALKQEVLHCKSSLEVEKLHAQNMLNAVNAERAHFNQLQATLELERRRGARTHEQDIQLIQELRAVPSPLSSTLARQAQLSDIEKMRGGAPSSTTRPDNSLLGEADNSGSHSGGHYLCAREKLSLSQSLLKAEEEISRLRQLTLSQDLLLGQTAADGNPSPAICRLLHKLYWKYRKADSWRKGLVYQKQYLLSLLQGFQATEDVALRMLSTSRRRPPSSPPPLHHIDGIGTSSDDDGRPRQQGFRLHSADSSGGRHFQHLLTYQSRGRQDSVDEAPLPSGSSSHSSADGSSGIASSPPMPARFRFRSAVQAVIALHRMQHLVHKWRLAACVPPAPVLLHKVELAVRTVPHGGAWRLGASTCSGFSMATARSSQSSLVSPNTSQASAATVLCHRLSQPPSPRTPSRPSQSQPASMREFVERLDSLHKQFGLSDDQHC